MEIKRQFDVEMVTLDHNGTYAQVRQRTTGSRPRPSELASCLGRGGEEKIRSTSRERPQLIVTGSIEFKHGSGLSSQTGIMAVNLPVVVCRKAAFYTWVECR